jgi:hypothetical protein
VQADHNLILDNEGRRGTRYVSHAILLIFDGLCAFCF